MRAGGRGEALKIRRTPAGVAGRDEISFRFCINACFREPASAAGPSKLEPKMRHFPNLNFSTSFFRQNLQNMRKVTPQGIPFRASNLQKSAKNAVRAACLKTHAKK